ncbi:MAG TPA: PqqD family protein [Terracidiphilus sp.]|jgi:hypothetical protein|nr:PqqD family protein [Terracidiphilus sp.]
MQIERKDSNDLVVNGLPDGSKVIVDSKNEMVYALNATAGAAWDACGAQTTLSAVAADMRRADPTITDQVAEQAILQLEEKKLIKSSGLLHNASRRQVLAGLTAVALPLVVSMTMSEQRAFAAVANSGQPTPPPTDPGGNNGDTWPPKHPQVHVSHVGDHLG